MILQRISAPAMRCVVGGPRGIGPAVGAMIGPGGLAGIRSLTPRTLDLLGLAAMEVLHTLVEDGCEGGGDRVGGRVGDRIGDRVGSGGISVELWLEPRLAVIAIGHAGPPLPDWLLANWDRGEEPALPDASGGWGWLLVREALDGVSAGGTDNRRLLFLEKRL